MGRHCHDPGRPGEGHMVIETTTGARMARAAVARSSLTSICRKGKKCKKLNVNDPQGPRQSGCCRGHLVPEMPHGPGEYDIRYTHEVKPPLKGASPRQGAATTVRAALVAAADAVGSRDCDDRQVSPSSAMKPSTSSAPSFDPTRWAQIRPRRFAQRARNGFVGTFDLRAVGR